MQTSLRGIAQKAKQLKKYRFRNLYSLLNSASLKEAFKSVNKKAATGIDKVSAKEFADTLMAVLMKLLINSKGRNIGQNWYGGSIYPKGRAKQDRWDYPL